MRIINPAGCLTTSVLLLAMLCTAAPAKIIHVDDDATGANDGSSWPDAYRTLQDALMMASAGDEIRVARGIYRPDQFVLSKRPNLGRMETFQLKSGVAIRGGYAGFGEPDPNARSIELYGTILSGDLSGNDIDVNDPAGLQDELTRTENSYHVVTGSGTDQTAVLDGFVITAGNADGPVVGDEADYDYSFTEGAGMYNDSGSPTLTRCTFTANSARYGGGIYNYGHSSPVLTHCTFSANSANGWGGGMYNGGSSPILTRCTFRGNWADDWGGGMANNYSSPTLDHCVFSGNAAADWGGGAMYSNYSSPKLTGCILWGDTPDEIYVSGVVPVITYCDVQGGWPGEGNIDVDPLFADPNDGDYHLKSQAGRYDPDSKTWVIDDLTSPCIDAAGRFTPIGNEPFPNGGIGNLGAYGGTAEASKSYFGEPVCKTIVAGDINGDCKIDLRDLMIMAFHWLQDNSP